MLNEDDMETDEGGEECSSQMEEGSQESVRSFMDMSGVEEEGYSEPRDDGH